MRYEHLRAIRRHRIRVDENVPAGSVILEPGGTVAVRDLVHFQWQVQMAYLDQQAFIVLEARLAKFARSYGLAPRATTE